MAVYLQFFRKYEGFVNIDITKYISSRIQVTLKDPESAEIELPVVVNLSQLVSLIDEHLAQIKVDNAFHHNTIARKQSFNNSLNFSFKIETIICIFQLGNRRKSADNAY